ncbi:MAG: hypothetical protein ABIP95_10880 [Pelobium sp.]
MADTTTNDLDIEADTVSTEAVPVFTTVTFIKAKGIQITTRLQDMIKETIDSVETIDFTGDQVDDYLVRTAGDKNSVGFEYWVSSDYKIIKKAKYYLDSFHYRWFINLDDDPEPEIYDAVGEEDGADYTIQDQNLITGKDSILLYINPVIIEKGIKYWGYPWDISNIRARKNQHQVQLYCSLNHQIIRDGGWEIDPKHQSQMPVIFFDGHHTQDFHPENVKDLQWLTLKEIVAKTKR